MIDSRFERLFAPLLLRKNKKEIVRLDWLLERNGRSLGKMSN